MNCVVHAYIIDSFWRDSPMKESMHVLSSSLYESNITIGSGRNALSCGLYRKWVKVNTNDCALLARLLAKVTHLLRDKSCTAGHINLEEGRRQVRKSSQDELSVCFPICPVSREGDKVVFLRLSSPTSECTANH